MATAYSPLLGLALPVQGELSGTWGDTVNNYITNYLDASVAGVQTLTTDADVTLTKTTGAALNGTSSQYAIINCTGARTVLHTVTAPAASKKYILINATTGGFGVKLVGAGPTTGVTVAAGTVACIVWNGTDFALVSVLTSAGVVPVANGGTGATSNAGAAFALKGANSDITSLSGLSTPLSVVQGGTGLTAPGTVGNVLTSNGTTWVSGSAPSKIQPVTASVAANALTLTVNPTVLDFRSSTLTSGTVNTRAIAAATSVTVPFGSTLNTINAVPAQLAILAIDNAGTVEAAVANIANGANLDETTLIDTIAIDTVAVFTGSIAVTTGLLTVTAVASGTITLGMSIGGALLPQGVVITAFGTGTGGTGTYSTNYYTAVASGSITGKTGNGIYSTVARTGVPFRVVGFVKITTATAGTWVTAPSTIQGVGGQALTALSSIGYGQIWQDVKTTPGRVAGTTYTNSTGKPIQVAITCTGVQSQNATLVVGGVNVMQTGIGISNVAWLGNVSGVVPIGATYSLVVVGATLSLWTELR
jgi:hypothetical protein